MLDVAIIGAGITGLSAGYELLKAGITSFKIFESSAHVGGKIRTEKIVLDNNRHIVLEHGADSFLSARPEVFELAQSLGIAHELTETQNTTHKFAIVRNQKLVPAPEGLKLMIPTSLWPFAFSPLISTRGKICMAADLLKARKKNEDDDESVASFITRRFGKEALDYLAEPLLAGVYGANPQQQSMAATFPHLCSLEQKHRSLILGMVRSLPKNAPRKSVFTTFKNGMQTLIDALAEQLSPYIAFNTPIIDLASLQARSVIITTNAQSAAQLLDGPAKALLEQLTTTSSSNIYFAFDRDAVLLPPKLSGFLVPKVEKSILNGASFTSQKFANRASEDICLIRAFIGGEHAHEDSDIVLAELQKFIQIKAKPLFSKTIRMFNANPLYNVGHRKLLDMIEQNLPQGIYLAGSPYRGVGIPDCVKQGKEMALKEWMFLTAKRLR